MINKIGFILCTIIIFGCSNKSITNVEEEELFSHSKASYSEIDDKVGLDSIKNVYFFPGQGSDSRVFKNIELPDNCIVHNVTYPIPDKGTTMNEYALKIASQIKNRKNCVFIGHSLGGMICTELADTLNPDQVIIISSAKRRSELPGTYRFQKYVPLNRVVPKRMVKMGSLILQPIVEPDSKTDRATFKSMLKAKDPAYLKWTVNMIINWERDEYSSKIIHIHGNDDRTIPITNVNYNYLIDNGSHMMVLTRGKEISEILNEILAGIE